MSNTSYHILRVGMGITFLWIAVFIFLEPLFWAGFIQPWAAKFLIVPAEQAMLGAAILDGLIGLFLIINVFTWVAALIGAIHLAIILIISGIDVITVRDIGLLAGAFALFWSKAPESVKAKFQK